MRGRLSPRLAIVLAVGLTLDTCRPASESADALAIVGASVWSPASGKMQPGTTILVRDGKIAWVGPAEDTRVPDGARIIEGDNRYVIPGLVDMHYHLTTGAMRYSRNDAGALEARRRRAPFTPDYGALSCRYVAIASSALRTWVASHGRVWPVRRPRSS